MLAKIKRLLGIEDPEPDPAFRAIERQADSLRKRLERLELVTDRQDLKTHEQNDGATR